MNKKPLGKKGEILMVGRCVSAIKFGNKVSLPILCSNKINLRYTYTFNSKLVSSTIGEDIYVSRFNDE